VASGLFLDGDAVGDDWWKTPYHSRNIRRRSAFRQGVGIQTCKWRALRGFPCPG
jgi:hypothetical protein